MLGSTCGVLTRGSRMVVFGLRPTSLIIRGFMFGESASDFMALGQESGEAHLCADSQ